MRKAGVEGQTCVPFTSLKTVEEFKAFVTSPSRGEDAIRETDISIRIFDIDVRYFLAFIPQTKWPVAQPFWMNSGMGTSSRLAEESLKHIELLREASLETAEPLWERVEVHAQIKERIAELLERAPAGPPRSAKVSPDDVYLFPSGTLIFFIMKEILCIKP